MIKLFLLILFVFWGNCSLMADEGAGGDQDLLKQLNNIKNPFEDGYPKPVVVQQPVVQEEPPQPVPIPAPIIIAPKPQPLPSPPPVVIPTFNLQGVMVGDEMHEAIINDKIVSLQGVVDGAQVISVSNKGVGMVYKGKKFFLKID